MSDEAKTEEQEAGKKKGGLKSLILVAIGAALGGAGVVFMAPKPEPVAPKEDPKPKFERVEHPDLMEFQVNALTDRGTKLAVIKFRFVYKQDKSLEKETFESLQKYWNKAKSRCLFVITGTKAKDMATPEGKLALRKRLVDELTLTLFPDGVAEVDDVYWEEFMIQ